MGGQGAECRAWDKYSTEVCLLLPPDIQSAVMMPDGQTDRRTDGRTHTRVHTHTHTHTRTRTRTRTHTHTHARRSSTITLARACAASWRQESLAFYNYANADLEGLCDSLLESDINSCLQSDYIEQAQTFIKDTIHNAMDRFIPKSIL